MLDWLNKEIIAWGRFTWAAIIFVVFTLIGGLLFKGCCVDHVDNYQMGYKFSSLSGEITVLPRAGYFVNPPLVVKVYTIDMRPMQVCVSANQRVLNCKLVRFNQNGFRKFIEWHGADNYDKYKLEDILKSYAYEDAGKSYPFLDIIREMKTEDMEAAEASTNQTPAPI